MFTPLQPYKDVVLRIPNQRQQCTHKPDMEFVQKFTPPDFQATNLRRQFHLISTALVIQTQKMTENGEIYTAGKNFILPPVVTEGTNLTSGEALKKSSEMQFRWVDLESIRPQIKSHG